MVSAIAEVLAPVQARAPEGQPGRIGPGLRRYDRCLAAGSLLSDDPAIASPAGCALAGRHPAVEGAVTENVASVERLWTTSFGAAALADGLTFDASGCDSLGLLTFVLTLERTIGRRLPMAAFHLDLTPRAVQAVVHAALRPTTAERCSTFLIPPIGGDRPDLATFRTACLPSLPMTVLTVPMSSLDDPALRMDDVLRDLADRVEAQAGPGPIGLAGYSRGGRLAALTALVLIERGRTIRFVAMLDTHGDCRPEQIDPRLRPNSGLRDAYWALPGAWRRQRWRGAGNWAAEWLARSTAWGLMRLPADRAARWARAVATLYPAPAQLRLTIDVAAHRLDQHLASWHRENLLAPGILSMPVILLRAMTQVRPRATDLGWAPYCSRLQVIPVKGDHESMLYAHGITAAQALTAAVDALAPVPV